MRRRAQGKPVAWLVLALAFPLLSIGACTTARDTADHVAYELNPFASTDLAVSAVSVHGPYLLVDVVGARERVRFLAPAAGACAQVLRPEVRLRYAKSGTFGRFTHDGEVCDPSGVASLEVWRDRQPRRRGGVVPRASARYAPLFEDADVLFVRGRFPLASKIGIPAGYDLVAMLPNDAPCREAVARGEGSLEFRPAGRDPFRIVVGGEACVLAGFARPAAP